MTNTTLNTKQELREKISDQLANLMVKASLKKLKGDDHIVKRGREYIRMHNDELRTIEHLISDTVNKVLDELEHEINDGRTFTNADVVSAAIEQARKEWL